MTRKEGVVKHCGSIKTQRRGPSFQYRIRMNFRKVKFENVQWTFFVKEWICVCLLKRMLTPSFKKFLTCKFPQITFISLFTVVKYYFVVVVRWNLYSMLLWNFKMKTLTWQFVNEDTDEIQS